MPLGGVDGPAWLTSDDVRRAFGYDRRSGRIAWLRLEGLSLDEVHTHGAIFHGLRPFGLCGDCGRAAPEVAVLDWTRVAAFGAEGVALYAVLARELLGRGVRVVACGPEDGDLAVALDETALGVVPGLEWVTGRREAPRGRVQTLGRGAVFGHALGGGALDEFLDDLEVGLSRAGITGPQTHLLIATVLEVLQNVCSHADAQYAAVTALLFPRRRPRVVQIGVADGGIGVAGHVLAQERHGWLAAFSDASVTEVVLHRALSGRDAAVGGGGMSGIIRQFLRTCDATMTLRTGTALLSLSSRDPDRYRKTLLTYGVGTQTRLEFRCSV